MINFKTCAIVSGLVLAGTALGGCSSILSRGSASRSQEVLVQSSQPAPGVVEYIWEEPMVNMVEVPPSLDPEGHYYRPSHQAVIEVRPGRWKYHKQ